MEYAWASALRLAVYMGTNVNAGPVMTINTRERRRLVRYGLASRTMHLPAERKFRNG